AILAMVLTASTGYLPEAVSPDSITASVPSMMALATSEASALVGRGFQIIDSNIWVAVMTGLPRELHWLMICYWTRGTSSAGIATPRSPRATMIPSATARISSMLSTAAWVSILAIILMGASYCSRILLISNTSAAFLTKEAAMK